MVVGKMSDRQMMSVNDIAARHHWRATKLPRLLF